MPIEEPPIEEPVDMPTAIGAMEAVSEMLERYRDDAELVSAIISQYERQRGIFLLPTARIMVIIPILDYLSSSVNLRGGFDPEALDESIRKIIDGIATDPDVRDENRENNARSSFSVIRSFWINFCGIPPFCSRRGPRGEFTEAGGDIQL